MADRIISMRQQLFDALRARGIAYLIVLPLSTPDGCIGLILF